MNETETALAAALAQTGFPFEHYIFQEATSKGWSTIPNRLYVDAEEDKTREMDLLCYKAEKGPEVTTYTALLISCKARTDKPWVLMTRPWPLQRPSWYFYPPVPTWTNSEPLRHELQQPGWGLEYFDQAAKAALGDWAEDSREEVFALQEFEALRDSKQRKLSPVRFKSLNDTSLYTGAMSLLKALAYELAALRVRRGKEVDRVAYQFNLIQMLDGSLYEASFASGIPKVAEIHRYRYFARTMLGGKEVSARIDFCTRTALPELLADMASVHRFNVAHFNQKTNAFYADVLIPRRLEALRSTLQARLTVFIPVLDLGNVKDNTNWLSSLEYKSEQNTLFLQVDALTIDDKRLNESSHFMGATSRIVKELYRYTGHVQYESDIPF